MRPACALPLVLAALAGLLPCQTPPSSQRPESGQAGLGAESEKAPHALKGSLDLRYVGRATDGAHDHDLFGYTDLDYGDARKHAVTAHVSARAAWDLDRDRDPAQPFRSVDDSRSGDVTARVYSAYLDLNGVAGNPLAGVVKRVRLGRQVTYETPRTFYLDGISVQTPPAADLLDLQCTAFFGVPTHLFESSQSGDVAAGGAVSVAPWRGGRLRLDYMHVADEYWFSTTDDDLVGIRWDQRIGDHLFVNVSANFFELEADGDVGAFAAWSDPEEDLNVTLRYSGLLDDETRRSVDFDYFTEILADYAAYDQLDLNVHKGFGDLYLEGGALFRELRHESKESLFNHEFRRYHGTLGHTGWPWKGTDASVTYELWDSAGDRFTTVGADVSRRIDDTWSASVGTFFQLFRYDVLRAKENEDVQVAYLKVAYKMAEAQRLRARFEYEDGERDDFFTLVLSMQVDF